MSQIQSILEQIDRKEVKLVFDSRKKDSLEILNEVIFFLKSRGRNHFIGNVEEICEEIVPLILERTK